MHSNKTLAAFAAFSLGTVALQAASTIVYSNAVNYSGTYFNPTNREVGDEIILAPGPRGGESFRFEYFGSGFSGDEQARLRFYDNSGPLGSPNPVSAFYDSLPFPLAAPTDPSGRQTLLFDLTFDNLILPNDFTWTVQFFGVTGAERAGLSIYDPPTVGNNYDDFWLRNDLGVWELRNSTNGTPVSFGAALTAVPEPSTYVLAILGGLCGFALIKRRARQS